MNGLYVAASGALSQLSQLESAASNLANGSTPGFRRLLDVMQADSGHGSPFQYATPEGAPRLDLGQGPIRSTGNPLDLAISGSAFITVSTPQGPAYTRDGELQVTPEGSLLAAGQPVARDGGGVFNLPPGPITIATDGSVDVNGAPVGKIALADPTRAAIVPLGGNLYGTADNAPLAPAADNSSTVHQGFLESSTGDQVGQMVAMMNVMRSYEAAMHSVQSIDENEDRAIQAFTLQA